jgi:hypothetical protein
MFLKFFFKIRVHNNISISKIKINFISNKHIELIITYTHFLKKTIKFLLYLKFIRFGLNFNQVDSHNNFKQGFF